MPRTTISRLSRVREQGQVCLKFSRAFSLPPPALKLNSAYVLTSTLILASMTRAVKHCCGSHETFFLACEIFDMAFPRSAMTAANLIRIHTLLTLPSPRISLAQQDLLRQITSHGHAGHTTTVDMPLLVFACTILAGKVQASGYHLPVSVLREIVQSEGIRHDIPHGAMTAMQFAILDTYEYIRVRGR